MPTRSRERHEGRVEQVREPVGRTCRRVGLDDPGRECAVGGIDARDRTVCDACTDQARDELTVEGAEP